MSQDNNNSEPGLPSVAVEPARRTHSRKHGRQFYNRPWNSNNYGPPMFFPCPNGSPGPGYMGYYYIDIPRMAPSTNVGYPVFDPWGYNHWQLVDSNPFAGYQRVSVCYRFKRVFGIGMLTFSKDTSSANDRPER